MADISDDEIGPLSVTDWTIHDAHTPGGGSDIDIEDRPVPGISQPIQKRRRVTRACDECRRKKIKCDGKQPCTHCSVYSYDCTYDKPSNRRRNPAPQYIEALEGRLHRAEALLRKFVPDMDLADANLDPAVRQEFSNREHARAQAASKLQANQVQVPPSAPDIKLTSMINSIGQLDLDESGDFDFQGNSSGPVFLKKMREQFRGMLDPIAKGPFLRSDQMSGNLSIDPLSAYPGRTQFADLPAKDVARRLCYYALSCATCLVRIVHIPTFYEKLDRIYEVPFEGMTQDEKHFLGLFYAVLALGCMYNNFDDSAEPVSCQAAMEEGAKYCRAARAILKDPSDCRDLVSIQALLFIILFLQATSNLSACYGFIGIALRSAMRLGLHRNIQHEKIDNIELESRKRVFYVIRQMDIYVSTLLGFPLLLHNDDIDQPYPVEIDDEFVTSQGTIQPPMGTPSFIQAFNAHSRLMETLNKITKYVYPMKPTGMIKGDSPIPTYVINYSKIKEIETDLHQWYEQLPEAWRPSSEGPIEVIRVRHLLRFAYAHVQLVLYRPFLHYVSPRLTRGRRVEELAYACAAAAVSVSRNIVHIGLEIRKQRVLSGPYWFMLYTEFFAIITLVFYAVENPGKPGCPEVLADARAGRQMIADLADKSMVAEMITNALTALFSQLPDMMEQGRARPVTAKQQPGSISGRSGSVASQYQPMTHVMSPVRSEDLMRSRSGQINTGAFGTPASLSSGDGMSGFDGNMYNVDMSSRATPESTSTPGGNAHSFIGQTMAPQNLHNPVNKLDSLMFPSEDPFAYPNQPMLELGFQPKNDSPGTAMVQDNNFFFPGSLDDMSDQFLGQPPPYIVQQQQQQQQQSQAQAPMAMTASMFDPNAMMGIHSNQPQQATSSQPPQPQIQRQPSQAQASSSSSQAQVQQQQQQQQAQPQTQPRQQQRGRLGFPFFNKKVKAEKQQERQIEQMFTEHGMQADFGSFFGSGRGGFQGM